MSNMSYCRYENTARDLRDCWDEIRDEDADTISMKVSASELGGLVRLVALCGQIFAALDSDRLVELAIERQTEDN